MFLFAKLIPFHKGSAAEPSVIRNRMTTSLPCRYPWKFHLQTCEHSDRFALGHPASLSLRRSGNRSVAVTCVEHVGQNEYIIRGRVIAFVSIGPYHHR